MQLNQKRPKKPAYRESNSNENRNLIRKGFNLPLQIFVRCEEADEIRKMLTEFSSADID